MAGKSATRRRKQRKRLFDAQGGKCHWCQCQCVISPKIADGKLPLNEATTDHIFSKAEPRRWERPEHGKHVMVMACWQCNNRRSFVQAPKTHAEQIEQAGRNAARRKRHEEAQKNNRKKCLQ